MLRSRNTVLLHPTEEQESELHKLAEGEEYGMKITTVDDSYTYLLCSLISTQMLTVQ
jgi:hypothetical protein